MLVEYAGTYGGPPPRDLPWPLFVLLVRESGRFSARRLLELMQGVGFGAGRLFTKNDAPAQAMQNQVEQLAYPQEREPTRRIITGTDHG